VGCETDEAKIEVGVQGCGVVDAGSLDGEAAGDQELVGESQAYIAGGDLVQLPRVGGTLMSMGMVASLFSLMRCSSVSLRQTDPRPVLIAYSRALRSSSFFSVPNGSYISRTFSGPANGSFRRRGVFRSPITGSTVISYL
jgi:hypothetical protein